MRDIRRIAISAGLFLPALIAASAGQAAESGSALYIGGSQGFGAGATPPPGTYATVGTIFYDGEVGAVIEGGVVDLNVGKTALAVAANALYVAPVGLLDGNLGVSATLPFASYTALEATASGAISGNLETSGWGIGDVSLKIQNGWSHGDFSHTASVTMWLPTGHYDTGFSPNTGKNHVGFDFGWAFTQFWQEPKIELSAAFGYSIELENPTTNYRNGDTFHVDAALAYRAGGGWTVGLVGYGIEQVSGDSGAGASLGDFKRRVYGLGPGLSYSGAIGGKVVSFSARHYREFAAENTFEGHITFVSGTMRF